MLIFTEMSYKPKAEVERIKEQLCLTEDESTAYDMLIYNKASSQQIAMAIYKSPRTVTRVVGRVRDKIMNYYRYNEQENSFAKTDLYEVTLN